CARGVGGHGYFDFW
nr:immunoglobulin heavy chain junction region [Macaca mulatta]MOV43643.1 immunoglobulin heavy chain junction region [Macaca mulatta]MOV43776.1 immunoglobulin heavy chain junction region [Macaca mulatta]